jgi:protocatechuate 3,4-dioxygenase beta subunit
MHFKKSIIMYYSIILFTILSLLNSSVPISSIIFAQNANSITPPPPPPPPLSNSLSSSSPPFPSPFSDQLSSQQMASSTNKTCILTPSLIEEEGTSQQTEGPYFVAGMPNRSDIRSDSFDGSIQQGIPLHLVIHVYKINDKGNNSTPAADAAVSCMPFNRAQVDIWHANSQGLYSGISQIGTEGKTYLRGYQTTDNNGTAKFDTIYPGWYQGRAIHIHVMVRAFDGGSNETFHWTSQMYLNNSINEKVHTQIPYSKHGLPPMTNEQDGLYTGSSTDKLVQSNAGQHLMLNLTKDKQGYAGTFNIIVNAPVSGK